MLEFHVLILDAPGLEHCETVLKEQRDTVLYQQYQHGGPRTYELGKMTRFSELKFTVLSNDSLHFWINV
jgi:hypothetical protein